MTDIATLGVNVTTTSAVKATSDLDRLGDQAAITGRQVKQSTETANRGLASMAGPMRGVTQQLSQVAQQGQVTGDYMQALAIQAADTGLAFGTIGTILGVAAGLLLPLARNALTGRDALNDLEMGVEDLGDALDSYKSYAENAMLSTDEMREKFGEASDELRSVIMLLEQVARTEAQDKIDGLAQSLSDLLGTAGAGEGRSALAKFFDVNIFLAFNDAQREAREQARLLTAEFQQQQAELQRANGDIDAQINILNRLLETTVDLADLSGERTDEERELIKNMAEALQLMIQTRGATDEVTISISNAADEAERLGRGLLAAVQYSAEVNAGIIRMGVQSGALPPQALEDAPETTAEAAYDAAMDARRRAARAAAAAAARSSGRRGRRSRRGGGSQVDREQQEMLRERDRILDSLKTEQDRYNDSVAQANRLLEAGVLTQGDYNRHIEQLGVELEQVQFASVIDGIDRLSDGIGDAVANAETFGEAWRGIGQVAISTIRDIASEFISSGVRQSLMGLLGLGGGLGGGGLFGGLFAGLFDSGGRIPAGQFGIVGERGPEIVTGPANVTSTADTARMMGAGQKMHVSVSVDEGGGLRAFVTDQAGRVVAQSTPKIVSASVAATREQIASSSAFLAPGGV